MNIFLKKPIVNFHFGRLRTFNVITLKTFFIGIGSPLLAQNISPIETQNFFIDSFSDPERLFLDVRYDPNNPTGGFIPTSGVNSFRSNDEISLFRRPDPLILGGEREILVTQSVNPLPQSRRAAVLISQVTNRLNFANDTGLVTSLKLTYDNLNLDLRGLSDLKLLFQTDNTLSFEIKLTDSLNNTDTFSAFSDSAPIVGADPLSNGSVLRRLSVPLSTFATNSVQLDSISSIELDIISNLESTDAAFLSFSVPEPSSALLVGIAGLSLLIRRRKQ